MYWKLPIGRSWGEIMREDGSWKIENMDSSRKSICGCFIHLDNTCINNWLQAKVNLLDVLKHQIRAPYNKLIWNGTGKGGQSWRGYYSMLYNAHTMRTQQINEIKSRVLTALSLLWLHFQQLRKVDTGPISFKSKSSCLLTSLGK